MPSLSSAPAGQQIAKRQDQRPSVGGIGISAAPCPASAPQESCRQTATPSQSSRNRGLLQEPRFPDNGESNFVLTVAKVAFRKRYYIRAALFDLILQTDEIVIRRDT